MAKVLKKVLDALTKEPVTVADSAADAQVVKDEAAAEIRYEKTLDDDISTLPFQMQEVIRAQRKEK